MASGLDIDLVMAPRLWFSPIVLAQSKFQDSHAAGPDVTGNIEDATQMVRPYQLLQVVWQTPPKENNRYNPHPGMQTSRRVDFAGCHSCDAATAGRASLQPAVSFIHSVSGQDLT